MAITAQQAQLIVKSIIAHLQSLPEATPILTNGGNDPANDYWRQVVIALQAVGDNAHFVVGTIGSNIDNAAQEAVVYGGDDWNVNARAGFSGGAAGNDLVLPRPGAAPPSITISKAVLQIQILGFIGAGAVAALPAHPAGEGHWEGEGDNDINPLTEYSQFLIIKKNLSRATIADLEAMAAQNGHHVDGGGGVAFREALTPAVTDHLNALGIEDANINALHSQHSVDAVCALAAKQACIMRIGAAATTHNAHLLTIANQKGLRDGGAALWGNVVAQAALIAIDLTNPTITALPDQEAVDAICDFAKITHKLRTEKGLSRISDLEKIITEKDANPANGRALWATSDGVRDAFGELGISKQEVESLSHSALNIIWSEVESCLSKLIIKSSVRYIYKIRTPQEQEAFDDALETMPKEQRLIDVNRALSVLGAEFKQPVTVQAGFAGGNTAQALLDARNFQKKRLKECLSHSIWERPAEKTKAARKKVSCNFGVISGSEGEFNQNLFLASEAKDTAGGLIYDARTNVEGAFRSIEALDAGGHSINQDVRNLTDAQKPTVAAYRCVTEKKEEGQHIDVILAVKDNVTCHNDCDKILMKNDVYISRITPGSIQLTLESALIYKIYKTVNIREFDTTNLCHRTEQGILSDQGLAWAIAKTLNYTIIPPNPPHGEQQIAEDYVAARKEDPTAIRLVQ